VITLTIGRSAYADIIIADASIAPNHAELVVTDDGRYFLTDCGSTGGSWREQAGMKGVLEPVRQAFVKPDEPLRLGEYACTASGLTEANQVPSMAVANVKPQGEAAASRLSEIARGRIERNPVTGEIVRRRG